MPCRRPPSESSRTDRKRFARRWRRLCLARFTNFGIIIHPIQSWLRPGAPCVHRLLSRRPFLFEYALDRLAALSRGRPAGVKGIIVFPIGGSSRGPSVAGSVRRLQYGLVGFKRRGEKTARICDETSTASSEGVFYITGACRFGSGPTPPRSSTSSCGAGGGLNSMARGSGGGPATS